MAGCAGPIGNGGMSIQGKGQPWGAWRCGVCRHGVCSQVGSQGGVWGGV